MTTTEELLKLFDQIDKDKNGVLTKEEVCAHLTKQEFPKNYVNQYMKKFDLNGDGKISKAEYTKVVKSQTPKERRLEMWKVVFDTYDKDKSGKLCKSEIGAVLQGNYDAKVLEQFMKDHDKNNDGQLDYNEFVAFLEKTSK